MPDEESFSSRGRNAQRESGRGDEVVARHDDVSVDRAAAADGSVDACVVSEHSKPATSGQN